MEEFLAQAFEAFGPLILKLLADWQADHNTTAIPTIEQLRSDYLGTIDSYLAQGAAWRAANPDA
jgi:hypothetical protein